MNNADKYCKIKRFLKLFSLVLLFLALSGCTVEETNTVTDTGLLKVMYLDVGQGDSILIESKGEAMLIDAGEVEEGDTVADAIASEHIKELKYIIGTHPHSDHIGGIAKVIQSCNTEEVFLSDFDYSSATYDNLLQVISRKKIKKTYPTAGDSYTLGDASFTFVTPLDKDYGDNANNYSLGIRLTNGKNSFLFTGDMEEVAEKDLVASGRTIEADVLKVNHHGSSTSSCTEFLKAVDPTYAVISVGKGNTYGHPASATLASLEEEDVQTYRTDKQGTIIITSDGKNLSVKTQNTYKNKDADNSGRLVYVTEKGNKYHRKDCKYLKGNYRSFSLKKAKEEGYEPCSVCKP
ncbi:Metal-dependent hydrolase, beta-lactamase superfamily II [Anaerocolumna jejuensis DSM 15929]|uniref:Metal-dependent hydrolase, beta-lactamase superfamily II n=1 Tax=Anaerocolumna jejuensis DSM 15929 TaxID=1121322 RepID=A0A1M6NH94_9FIRM|nr:ComEC/Rec2 family competence protein [Anaerocolumna jejuensis]SHJ95069.1 Metal-dependent hydrolase, beta-lactamase superfamily II [Anaerocolumna jejuensis DSM 15929]